MDPNSCDHLIISQQVSADRLILNNNPLGGGIFNVYLRWWIGEITKGKKAHIISAEVASKLY